MAENSAIEWTDHTFNGWIGCTKVGPGCDHCYAEQLATTRLQVPWGPGAPRRRTAASTWAKPRRWNRLAAAEGRRYRVFCSSLADVFDNEVPAEWRADLFALIRATPNLDWLLVTKRIGNAAKMADAAGGWPVNVWLGATIVNQAEADRDVAKLLAIEGPRFRFLSMEPLLGSVDLVGAWAIPPRDAPFFTKEAVFCDDPHCWRGGTHWAREYGCRWGIEPKGLPGIDWIIAGGESGSGARPMHPEWAQSLRDQCAAAGVPFLFKQWGEWAPVSAIDEKQLPSDQLYHPLLARHRPEGPRRCKVSQLVMQVSGRIFLVDEWSAVSGETPAAGDFAYAAGSGAMLFMAIGKMRAGRLLDGVQHDGYPASSGGRPDAAPLTDLDAPAPVRAGVSAPKAALSKRALAAAKPETQ